MTNYVLGASIPCVFTVLSQDGTPSSEVIFINERLQATVHQPPALMEEGDFHYIVGVSGFSLVKSSECPTTVNLEGTMYLVNPPSLTAISSVTEKQSDSLDTDPLLVLNSSAAGSNLKTCVNIVV